MVRTKKYGPPHEVRLYPDDEILLQDLMEQSKKTAGETLRRLVHKSLRHKPYRKD